MYSHNYPFWTDFALPLRDSVGSRLKGPVREKHKEVILGTALRT